MPWIHRRTLRPVEIPPLATDNLLSRNTDGVLRVRGGVGAPHQCSLGGGSMLPSVYADARCIDRRRCFKGTRRDRSDQAVLLLGDGGLEFKRAPLHLEARPAAVLFCRRDGRLGHDSGLANHAAVACVLL